ncbi:hypothetical protein DL93DRAFT_2096116 [Clavulina sp. PMI_390]|nr:hypothetical protein DL93DRAFT_2096116 [Clavulina sp. PMI_390]
MVNGSSIPTVALSVELYRLAMRAYGWKVSVSNEISPCVVSKGEDSGRPPIIVPDVNMESFETCLPNVTKPPSSETTQEAGTAPIPLVYYTNNPPSPVIPFPQAVVHHSRHPDHFPGLHKSSTCRASKTTCVQDEVIHLPNGFMVGTMSDESFCRWVLSGSPWIRNAIIQDVTWWSAKRWPFHHQFVVLSINYTPPNTSPSTYNIVLERIGKGTSLYREAQHRVTIHSAQSLKEFCYKNRLLLGLFNKSLEERENDPIRWAWIDELANASYWPFLDVPGFATRLDKKWRGPPATLAHVARSIQHIVASAPQYNLASTNCYYFSRLLVHAIALRHYSFSSVLRPRTMADALNPYYKQRGKDHSTTPIVFLLLKTQQDVDGTLFHLNALLIVFGLILFIELILAIVLAIKGFSLYFTAISIGFASVGLGWLAFLVIFSNAIFSLFWLTLISWFIGLIARAIIIGAFFTLPSPGLIYAAIPLACIAFGASTYFSYMAWRGRRRRQRSLHSQTEAFIRDMGTSARTIP